MAGISEAFYEATQAVASQVPERPLPQGLCTAETDKWKLSLNASGKPVEHGGTEIPPYNLLAEHKEYFILSLLGPDGGVIGGGMTEDQFIEEMRAIHGGNNA